MKFIIIDQSFQVENNQLKHHHKIIDLNDKTQKALLFFLNSNNTIISKDQLLTHVWLGVIVSDASIFKQIQTLRNLFNEIGLPNDTIENVYGKGYRLKYPVIISGTAESHTLSDHKTSQEPHMNPKKSSFWFQNKWLTIFTPLVIMTILAAYFLWQNERIKVDKLNQNQKQTIVQISTDDWQQGLDHINHLLADAKNAYSIHDLAYLYQKKGQAEKHLQMIDESLVSLTESLKYYQLKFDSEGMGQTNLLLSQLYDYIDNSEKQQNHIRAAIELFNQSGNEQSEIDAYYELAFLQKKSGQVETSITTYETAIARAKALNDPTGEMIGINNLAATYMIINDTDKAIELAEQGLKINLSLGNGQHIANSYSFISQLAQQQGNVTRAFKMIEQALKYQLETNSHKNLSAKLMSLNYLLLETHQYKVLNEILVLTDAYAKSLRIRGGSAVIDLYQGMQLAYQNNWPAALKELTSARDISVKNNFNYKRPMIEGYLSLAETKNNNHLKAIEIANNVLQNTQSGQRETHIAQLVLAISYDALDNHEMSLKWADEATNSSEHKWPIENRIRLNLFLSILPENEISQRNSIQQHLNAIDQQIALLATQNTLNGELILKLKNEVKTLID